MSKLTIAYTREILDFDPVSGVLTWKLSLNRQVRAGERAGTVSRNGYVVVTIAGRKYMGHRLGWFLYHGVWPKGQLDHENHKRADNRLSNLQDGTHTDNQHNRSRNRNNKTGVTGVRKTSDNRWIASICVNKSRKHLGIFQSFTDAVLARKSAESQYGFHYNHGY